MRARISLPHRKLHLMTCHHTFTPTYAQCPHGNKVPSPRSAKSPECGNLVHWPLISIMTISFNLLAAARGQLAALFSS